MRKLSYGSFEVVLRAYITPKITSLELAEILLTSPAVDARNADRTTQRKSYNIDSPTVTRICSGERKVPPSLRKYHTEPDALEFIKLCFSVDIVPRIQECAKIAVLQEVLSLVKQDTTLSAETRSYFERCAAKEGLGDFLAEVYLYAVSQRAATKQTANLPGGNRFFYGREIHLAVIAERFQSGIHVQGLSGMGGVGKTQLALQYAHTHLTDYGVVWWLNAENRLTLQCGISAFLSSQKLMPKGADVDGVRRAFLDYFEHHGGWLLIYDNAEYGTSETYAALKDFFPQSTAKGHILLTTRCRCPFEDAVQMEIPVFDTVAAVEFLQHRSRLGDSPQAEKLAKRLGCLPLALEYAAAYIRETPGVDYASYIQKLEQYSVKVLDRKVGQLDYKMTVRETFHITLDKLLEDAPTNPISRSAAQFLNICAFLAPDNIEIGIFAAYGGCLPEPVKSVLKNELDRDELVRELTRYSLVRVERDAMSMHRLLQEVLCDELGPDEEILCINYAYGVFYSAFYALHTAPVDTIRNTLSTSAPHVQMLLSRYVWYRKQGGQAIPDKIMVAKEYFSWTALLLTDTKHLSGAELLDACCRDIPILQAAVDFYDLMGCDQTIYQADVLLLLAQSYAQLGDTLAAFRQYSRALETSKAVVEELPTDQTDQLQQLYQKEAFQLAFDICAAIASSGVVQLYPELMWQNFECLITVTHKQALCCTSEDDSNAFLGAWMTLYTFSKQVANFTHRAFVLRMDAPVYLQKSRNSLLANEIYGFFLPAEDAVGDTPVEVADGFDILLDSDSAEKNIAELNSPWRTLAFAKEVQTGDDMLKILMEAETAELNLSGGHALYGAIYSLAKYLKREDVAAQYKDRAKALPSHPKTSEQFQP